MNFNSIKTKLVLLYLVIFISVFFILNMFIYFQFHNTMINEIDRLNYSKAEEIKDIIQNMSISELNEVIASNIEAGEELGMYYSKQFLQIYDIKNKKIIIKSKNLKDYAFPVVMIKKHNELYKTIHFNEEGENESDNDIDRIRYVTLLSDNGKYIIQIGNALNIIEKSEMEILYLMLIVLPIAIALSIVAGIFLTNTSFKPVRNIIDTLHKIEAENLSMRLKRVDTGDEIEDLTKTINRMLNRLESSFNEIKSFSSLASHELRTPLTIIRGSAEVTLRKERDTGEYKEVLINILEEVARLQKIINNLLILSRVESSQLKPNIKLINFSNLVEEIQEQAKILAEEKKIVIKLNKDADAIFINANELRLREMLLNLIENSIKYTDKNGKIVLEFKTDDENLKIEISDNGMGISKKDLPYIWEPFYKGENAIDNSTGLGLSIVKKIVEYHNGTINVESTLGTGTKFTILLPINRL